MIYGAATGRGRTARQPNSSAPYFFDKKVVAAYIKNNKTTNRRENNMELISLMVTLAVVGVVLWLINAYVPMPAAIKKIMNIVVVIVVCLWLLQVFGLIGSIRHISVN